MCGDKKKMGMTVSHEKEKNIYISLAGENSAWCSSFLSLFYVGTASNLVWWSPEKAVVGEAAT